MAQVQLWGACTQSEFTNESTAMGFDSNNNLYVTGYLTGESAFAANVTFNSAQGNGDIYVAKYNASGALLWVKKFGGSMSDRAYDLKVDNNGDILVSGQFFGTVNFGGQTLQSVANSKDIFLVKMNPQGDILWAISEGGSMGDNMYALAVDSQNKIILTGQFSGNATIAGQTFTSALNPDLNQPSYDIFVSKYDSNGNPLWAVQGEAPYEDRGMALGADAQNNIYLAGQFSDTLQLAGQTFNNAGYNTGFIAKLSPNGTIQWFNRISGGMVLPYDLVVGTDNQITVCGDFLGSLIHQGTNGLQTLTNDFDRKVFVSTVNEAGHVVWQRALGSDNELSARGIARDGNNQLYVTGHFRCALTELQQSNTALFNSVGFRDIYLWTLNAAGSSLQTKQMGGKKNDYAYDIQVNSFGQPFICGSYIENLFIPNTDNFFQLFPQNNFSLSSSLHGTYYHFYGDQSANSFVSNALNTQSVPYNYFANQSLDSLNGFISQDDTVHICVNGSITYNTLTDYVAGPDYDFLWNTGDSTQVISVSTPGDYWVDVSRVDNCISGTDSVHVIIHQLPEMPLLSDDFVQYTNADLTLENVVYHYCPPQEFNVWFSPLAPNTTIEINGPQTFHTDTDPHLYSLSGYYSVHVTSEYCSRLGNFEIIHDTIYDKDIDPLPKFIDSNIVNDTLILCEGDLSEIRVIDLLTNPQQDFSICPTTQILSESFQIVCNGTQIPVAQTQYHAYFTGTITGWYELTYTLITGYDNTCGIDTLFNQRFDSLYVIVNPLPQASVELSYGSLLCPNGSVYLTTNNVLPGFTWTGPSIDWISSNMDSVQVSSTGNYSYSGTITDPVTGCSNLAGNGILLNEKIPPSISTFPEDAIVCPYDSVLMSVPPVYVSYNWTGPSGTELSLTDTNLDAEMGFYYCTVLDDEGCFLTTPPVEIQEFATPYLFVEPNNSLCPGQQVVLSAVFTGSGSVNWLPPLSGSAQTQIINTPGWYKAELTACGITTVDSVLILDGSFTPLISTTDTLLCFGQQIVISGTPANAYFQWSNGIEGINSIQIEEAGNHSATVTNDFGCVAQTNVVAIQTVLGSAPPNSYSVTICEPTNLFLETAQNTDALWFDDNFSLLDTAVTYTNLFSATTTLYVAYLQNFCPLVYGTVEVILVEPITPIYAIFGDNVLCYNDSSEYFTDWSGSISWAINGSFISNDSNIILNASSLTPTNILSATLENDCYSSTLTTNIIVNQQQPLVPYYFDTLVCPESNVEINFITNHHTIFTVGDSIPSTNGSIVINVSQPISYQFYALDSMGCLSDSVNMYFDVHISNFVIEEIFVPWCTPDTLIMASNAGESVHWQINQFNDFVDTLNYLIVDAGVYYISANYTDSLGCNHFDEHVVTIFSPSNYELADTIVCIGETIYTAFSSEIVNGSLTFIPIDSMQVDNSTTLTYTVYNDFGCPYTNIVNVEAIDCSADFPNVITPNNDGVNDTFIIQTALMEPQNQLVILNRWGVVVFEELGYRNTFNGNGCAEGVYFYEYQSNRNDPTRIQRGIIHIVR